MKMEDSTQKVSITLSYNEAERIMVFIEDAFVLDEDHETKTPLHYKGTATRLYELLDEYTNT